MKIGQLADGRFGIILDGREMVVLSKMSLANRSIPRLLEGDRYTWGDMAISELKQILDGLHKPFRSDGYLTHTVDDNIKE